MSGLVPIETPHLPKGKVGLVVIGERYRALLADALEQRGTEVLWLPDAPGADPRLAGHADLSVLHLGGDRLVAAKGDRIVNLLTNRGFSVQETDREFSAGYPRDCGLNGCLVGRRFLHRLSLTDGAVLRALPAQVRRIDAAQGYARCSVCIADERSIVTSDPGIAKAAALDGMEVLQIHPGFVELPGFDTGFLGGASFRLSETELAFTGRLDGHPDRARIESFLSARGVRPVYLTERPVFDIGSAIPLLAYSGLP